MYRYICKHPRVAAVAVLIIGMVLALLYGAPRMHNDDMQQMFLICNGGAGDTVPFGLYNNVVFGNIIRWLMQLAPAVNWYLIYMLITIVAALGTLNEFVFRHRAAAEEGAWAKAFMFIAILLLVYINQYCLSDQQVQYTHTAVLAGAGAAMVLFDALCGHAGRKRLALGIFLFFSMYILRPEVLMSFCFLALAAVAAWYCATTKRRPGRQAVIIVSGMLAVFAVCAICEHAAYAANPDWNEALTYRKQRVRIQDFPDNSGVDKSQALAEAGIAPEEFNVFKHFVYVPSMDSAEKIQQAHDIHIRHCKGLFGLPQAARVGLTTPTLEKLREPFLDLVELTPWFPLVFICGVLVVLVDRKSARIIVPALAATMGYICLLLLSGRCTGRVLNPALFFATGWILAFLPSGARMGKYRLIRWGAMAGGLLCFAACMRHYHVHLPKKGETAADVMRAHPENTYLAATWQAGPAYRSGITGCRRQDWEKTNVIPIADGWIFYTPAYRAFLKARGISNPYLLLPEPNTYVIIKDYDGANPPKMLALINTIYAAATNGGQLSFELKREMGPISFWQAVAR